MAAAPRRCGSVAPTRSARAACFRTRSSSPSPNPRPAPLRLTGRLELHGRDQRWGGIAMGAAIIDETKAVPDFLPRIVGILNDGMLCLATSLGHQTGLFDTMADGRWATSAEIARRAHLNERYVREWLGAMVTGR